MRVFYSYLLNHPKGIIALLLLITVTLAVPAWKIQLDGSLETMMVENDPDRLFFEEVRGIFGNDEVLVVGLVHPETIFRPDSLRKIQRISGVLENMDGVERVVSLATVYDIIPTEEGIEVKRPIREIPEDENSLKALRSSILKQDLFRNTLVSEDGKAAAINAFMENHPGDESYRDHIVRQVEEMVATDEGPESIYLAGVPYSTVMANRLQRYDMTRFAPLATLLIAVTLFLAFGSIRGILIPLVTVGMATVWTLGVSSLLGKSITPLCTTTPSLIMAIGSSYTIHVLSRYYATIQQSDSDRQGLAQSFTSVSLPVFVSGITTLAGFVAIAASRIPAVRDFGIFGMLGITFACLLSLALVPALLALLKAQPPGKWGLERTDRARVLFERLATFNVRNSRTIIIAFSLFFCLGILGIPHIETDTDYIGFMKKENPVVQNLDKLERHFAGSLLIYVVLEGDVVDILKDPTVVHVVDRLQATLDCHEWVDWTTSYLDYLKAIYGALQGDGRRICTLPVTQEEISQCLLLYSLSDPEALDHLVNHDFSKANIMVRSKNMGTREARALIQDIEASARQILPKGLHARVAGTARIVAKTSDQMAIGQTVSISIALFIIFFILCFTFRSFKIGLISMIPNFVPVGILFGIMGWLGISLNIATSLIAAVTLGIAVDDTIHLMMHFKRELKTTDNKKEAIRNALISTGKPITCTTIALCLGFAVLCLSDYMPIIYFGYLTGLTLGICLLANLLFLPCLLLTAKFITGRSSI